MNRKILDVVLLLLVLTASYFVYMHRAQTISFVRDTLHKPCSIPIAYRVGTIDGRFGLTKEAIVEKLQTASSLWSDAYGKPLFAYAPNDPSALPINFIYDRRQQTLVLGSAIDSSEATQKMTRSQIEAMQAQQTAAQRDYAAAVDALNSESKAYAEEVRSVNARGGATPEEYARLQAEKTNLED